MGNSKKTLLQQVEEDVSFEKIEPGDETKYISVAEFKQWQNRTYSNLNAHLQKFQGGVVQSEQRCNLAWNTINAFLRAFLDKKLVTEMDVLKAGQALMTEAKQNMKIIKDSSRSGIKSGHLKETPLDILTSKKYAEDKKVEDN